MPNIYARAFGDDIYAHKTVDSTVYVCIILSMVSTTLTAAPRESGVGAENEYPYPPTMLGPRH